MMKQSRIFLTLVFLLSIANLFAQDTALQRVLMMKEDSEQVKALIKYGSALRSTDKEGAMRVCKTAFDKAEKHQYYLGAGNALMSIASMQLGEGDYAQTARTLSKALDYCKKAGDIRKIGNCYFGLSLTFFHWGLRDSAMIYEMEGIKTLEHSPPCIELVKLFVQMGTLLFNADEFEKAAYYDYKGLETAKIIGDTAEQAHIYTALGDAYIQLHDLQKAAQCSWQSMALAESVHKTFTLASAYTFASFMYAKLHKTDSAIWAGQRGVKYGLEDRNMNAYLQAAVNLSDAYDQANNQDLRMKVLKEVYRKIQLEKQSMTLDVLKRLADAAAKSGHFQEACGYYNQVNQFRDSADDERSKKIVTELEMKYQTVKKEQALSQKNLEVAQKEVQLQKSRAYTFYTAGATLIILLIAILALAYFRNKQKLAHKEIQSIKKDKEIQVLQALMQGEEKERSRIAKDLHDGVAGLLAAVKMHLSANSEIAENLSGYKQAIHLLNEASAEVRKTSHNLMPEVLLQHGLHEALRRYCLNISGPQLQVQYYFIGAEQRFTNSFELSVYRIVQELLNNVFKHSRASEAIVQLSIQPSVLSISIEDNGIGLSGNDLQTQGMGLNSLKYRVSALNGNIELHAETGGGFNAYLEFNTDGLTRDEKPDHRLGTAVS